MSLRDAVAGDVSDILAIYNEVITTSAAIYIGDPVSQTEREAWLTERQAKGDPVLAAVKEERILGYACYHVFRGPWSGFRYAVEHSLQMRKEHQGHGVGSQLMQALIERAQLQGKHVMIGAIDAENDRSIRFHRRFGFEISGYMPEVGYKFGRWRDLIWMQRRLSSSGSS